MKSESKIRKRKGKGNFLTEVKHFYQLLKISWGIQTEVFFKKSTLHGVRYLAEKERPFRERFLWFCCIWASLVTTVVIIISLWEKFQTNPTITGLDTDFHNFEVPFPAVSVCIEPKAWKDIIEDDYTEEKPNPHLLALLDAFSYNSLEKMEIKNLDEQGKDKSLHELFSSLALPCNTLFTSQSCEFLSVEVDCCKVFRRYLSEVGLCYMFNSIKFKQRPLIIKPTDLSWSLKFNVTKPSSNAPISVYIHDFKEVPTIDFSPQHYWDYLVEQISFSMKQTYTTNDTRQLSVKQRHCVFEDEIKLENDHLYTFTGCTRQCRMKNALKKCNCVPPFYRAVDNKEYCRESHLPCLQRHLKEILSVDGCDCQLGCLHSVYEVEKMKTTEYQGNYTVKMETNFVSWPMVKYKREVLFGWVDLLVSFGGIAGLFLGCSLLSGVEIIYFFTVRAVCMVFTNRSELESILKNKHQNPVPDYDISLVPYFIRKPVPGSGLEEIAKRFFPELSNYYALKESTIRVRPQRRASNIAAVNEPPFGIEFLN